MTSQPNNTAEIIQKRLAVMINDQTKVIAQKDAIIKDLEKRLGEKDKECTQLKETKKTMEIKNDEIFKNCTKVNMSDLTEIKYQYENDKRVMNEMIKTLQATLTSKNDIINQLTEELNGLREQCELERKKNIQYFSIKSSNSNNKNKEVQFHQLSSENTSLKASLITNEEAIEKLIAKNKVLTEEKEAMVNDNSNKVYMLQSKLDRLMAAYEMVIKDFSSSSEILAKTKKDMNEISKINTFLDNDIVISQKKNLDLEKENIELKSENASVTQRIQTYIYEVESLKKEISTLERDIADSKLSKQIFQVSYSYMGMPMYGSFIIEKEGNSYVFIIENKTATRKFSFLDIEINMSMNDRKRVVITFNNGAPSEEYMSEDSQKIIDTYMNFKQKVVSISDISSDMKSKKDNTQLRAAKTETQLKGLFDFL